MSKQSLSLLGVVVCMEGDLGLNGDILKRYEAFSRGKDKMAHILYFPLEKSTNMKPRMQGEL